jgi:thiamine pyrophosphate-dependent acetolactate synthase large subunit-like protein
MSSSPMSPPRPTSTSLKSHAGSRAAASYDNAKVVNRFDLTKRLVAKLKNDEAVIGGIGNTNFDLWSARRRPQNFYMLGSMGLAIPIALGVALAQPRRHVIALEGDGSLLMQLGCLTTVAALKPANLTIVIMDNGLYQITGCQPTPAAGIADYVALARAAGLAKSAWAADEEDFDSLVDAALAEGGPTFIAARIDEKPGVGTTDRDPVQIRERFMHGLGVRAVP